MSSHRPDDERLRQEAIDWLLRLDAARADPKLRERLTAWLATSPAHRKAWEDVLGVWQGYRPLADSDAPGARPLPAERRAARRRRHVSRLTPWLAGAGLCLVAVLLVQWSRGDWRADWATGVGERRDVTLPDGSRADLAAQTALALRYDAAERHIELLHGEVVFQVHRDPSRPFVVESNGGSTRVLGTEFLVASEGADTTVAVFQGTVEVRYQTTLRLSGGHAARYGRSGGLAALSQSEIPALTTWRKGYLRFSGTPLSAVIAKLNRYHPAKVVLVNRTVANRPISGLFPLEAADQIIRTIAETTPLRTQWVTPYLMFLY